jgi:hypothetical protein
MMRISNPVWNSHMSRIDRLIDDFKMAQLPADGDVIERSRIVTERFKVVHKDNGEIRLIPITEEKQDG